MPTTEPPSLGSPSEIGREPKSDPSWVIALQALLLLVLIAIRFAEPVGDGDLFWQMAYGKYMLENHTLVPDHTIYSWTPADNPYLYCSWVAEIALYLLHQLGGLPLLFAFRYLVVLYTVALAVNAAAQVGWHRRALFWSLLTWMVSASYVGSILKPELFSLGFMSTLAWLIFRFRLAAHNNQPFTRYLVGIVLTIMIWANTHGVFLFGLAAMGLYTVGELLNWALSPELALPSKARRPLGAAAVGSCLAAFCTPYGWSFVKQSFAELLSIVWSNQSAGDKAAYSNLAAHLPVWKALAFHFHEYLAVGVVIIVLFCSWLLCQARASRNLKPWVNLIPTVLTPALLHFVLHLAAAKILLATVAILLFSLLVTVGPAKGKFDWPFLVINGLFCVIFTVYLRSTFYWPPFLVYTSLYLIHVLRQHPDYDPKAASYWLGDFFFGMANLLFFAIYYTHIDQMSVYLRMEAAEATKFLTLGGVFAQSSIVGFYAIWRVVFSGILTSSSDNEIGVEAATSERRERVGYLEPRMWCIGVALVANFLLCFRGAYESIYYPYASSWCGFGITYWNPVDEVEFIKKYHPNIKSIINDYDSGGYLIWALYPQTKVLIDPRSFPYRKFWAEYIAYEHGQIGLEFLDRFKERPDVCLVSLKNQSLWRTYLRNNKDWVPGWVGTAYVVFVKRGFTYPAEAANFRPGRFETLRNAQKCLHIYQFGIESNLFDISWQVLDVMKRKFNNTPGEKNLVGNLEAFKESIVALQANDLTKAIEAQERCLTYGLFVNAQLLGNMYKLKMQRIKETKGESDPEYQETLQRLNNLVKAVNQVQGQ